MHFVELSGEKHHTYVGVKVGKFLLAHRIKNQEKRTAGTALTVQVETMLAAWNSSFEVVKGV